MDEKGAVLAQLDPIASQMEALRLSAREEGARMCTRIPRRVTGTAPTPSSAHSVIGKVAKASNPQRAPRRDTKITPSAASTKTAKKQEGGPKKVDGEQGPAARDPQAAQKGKGGATASSQPQKGKPGSNKGQAKPPVKEGKAPPAKAEGTKNTATQAAPPHLLLGKRGNSGPWW